MTMSPVDKGPVANTDQELMAAAFTDEEQDFDDTDRSLEEMGDGPEGQIEDDDELVAAEGDPKKPGEPAEEEKPADKPGEEPGEPAEPEEPRDVRGLRAEMLAERKQRQAAEAAATAMREEIAAERARFDRLLSAQPQQRHEPPPAPAKPDPVLDPDGYERYVVAQAEQRYTMRRIEETFAETHEALGKEFEAAYVNLQRLNPNNPVDQAIGNRIYTAPNPAKALMRWHREQTLLQEMGNDPAAYRQKMRDEFLNDPDMVKAVLTRVREQRDGGPQGAPRNVTRLPPSLNRARGGSSANELLGAADNEDGAIFDYAMNGRG
jgi:hypothetical protein